MNVNVYFLIFSLFPHLSRVNAQARSYGDILRTLKYPDKLVFDVTDPINNELVNNSTITVNLKSLNKTGIELSPVLYYRPSGSYFKKVGEKESTYVQIKGPDINDDGWGIVSKANSFLSSASLMNADDSNFTIPVTTNASADFQETAVLPKDGNLTIILHMQKWSIQRDGRGRPTQETNVVTQKLIDIISLAKSRFPETVTVGLDYDFGWLDSSLGWLLLILEQVDIVILKVDLSLENFVLSYSMFKTDLKRRLSARYYSFVKENSLACQVYIKLNFLSASVLEPGLEMTEELYQKYYFYLLRFSVNWVNDGEREALILPPFPKSLKKEDILNGVDLKKLVVRPVLLDSFNIGWIPVDVDACRNRKIMDQYDLDVASIFQNHGLDQHYIQVPAYLPDFGQLRNIVVGRGDCNQHNQSNCRNNTFQTEDCDQLKVLYTTLGWVGIKEYSHFFSHDVKYSRPAQLTQDFVKRGVRTLPLNVVKAAVSNPYRASPYDYPGVLHKDQLPKLTFECSKNLVDSVFDLASQCNFTGNQPRKIIWNVDLNQTFANVKSQDMSDLSVKLIAIQVQRDQFLQRGLNAPHELQVVIGHISQLPAFDMYCHPNEILVRAMGREIINFARIHNISIEVENVLAYTGWRMLKLMGPANNLFTLIKLPIYVSRDYSNKFLIEDEVGREDSCMEWTVDVPLRGISLNAEYFGTILNMSAFGDGLVSSKELETMLLFIFHKFSVVEIIPVTVSHLDIIIETFFKPEFVKELAFQESKSPEVYIRIDTKLFNRTEFELVLFMKKLNKVHLKPVGLHFTNWNDSPTIDIARVQTIMPEGVSLGISLEDCLSDMLMSYFNGFDDSLSQLDYIVCNVKHTPEMVTTNINREKMQRYLDSTLYIQRYLGSKFPNLDNKIIFRLNALPSRQDPGMREVKLDEKVRMFTRNQTSDFLTFHADVNQYARLTKTKFFAMSAFDDLNGEQDGWWSIENFTDLTDTSHYVEKEAHYLRKQKIWRPEHKKEGLLNWTEYLAIGSATFIIFVLIISIIVLRTWYHRKFRLLTPKEIRTFRYGKEQDGSGVGNSYQFDCRKFPKEFEISRNSITLWKVIGQGNFGLVYDATLTHSDGSTTPVAVKIPKLDCSKQAFLSMLSELKVLSYVGRHPNVMEFVGGCIKEIGNGNVCIATRLYENGSLLDYLRKLHSELPEESYVNVRILSEMTFYELNRFSHEIAAGMEYVGNKKIVHGDLATRNVLLDSNLTCKIADFGLSRKLYEYAEYIKKNSEPLPWRWMAVESLKRMEFTVKSDVHSYGVTLWEIFSLGSIPYPGLTWTVGFADELENGMRMESPAFSTDEIYETMLRCWTLNPEQRPSFNELSQVFGTMRNDGYTHISALKAEEWAQTENL